MSFTFDYPYAIEFNSFRIHFLESLNIDWKGKTVLETGMGARGDLSKFLYDQGAIVYAFDARQENVDEFKKRNPYINNVYTIDFDKPSSLESIGVEKFDYVLCFGTLYHLKNPSNALVQMAKYSDNLLLSTIVGNGPDWNSLEEPNYINQSFNGFGCRPNPRFLEAELKNLYSVVTQHYPNHEEYTQSDEQRNMFICSK